MPIEIRDHSAFQALQPWAGVVPAGFACNFVGQLIDKRFMLAQTQPSDEKDTNVTTMWPPPSEETFEWIALIDSIRDAGSVFTMAELGAGYGRWMVSAARVAGMIRPDLTFKFIAVEAEPSHFAFIHKHFKDNGLRPEEHFFFEGVVNGTGEPAHFVIGHPEAWYGQTIMPPGYTQEGFPDSHTIEVPAARLSTLLEPYDLVDLIDMDIQGGEEEVVLADIDAITARVRRITIGTHSEAIHENVGAALAKAGWEQRYSYPPGGLAATEFGEVDFQDGVQYWQNASLQTTS